ncbi:hypothetical protein [Seonamhaeicola maritimus]|uniref:Lipocalin-like domain-containing protein n=1 Tax=Seonamhaeicola maritimus TaxID=2591822 RepID=A0A5C7GG43_9FLAO|nr:hypothetical protein [Seonamhaeicola maritimus]TXG36710.1 hypothetical protein FUA22_09005 [Seonamhaeicola maritimus]
MNNQIELDGNWIITEMTYEGKSVYPKTLNQTIRIVYGGYENSESMNFKVSDSTLTLPGFESEQLKTEFAFDKGKLKINSNRSNSELELTNKIFSGTYDWAFSNIEKTLKLKSDKTYINMISQEKIVSDSVDKVFDGL